MAAKGEALDASAAIGELEDRLSEPTRAVVEALGRLPGDILILGAGGKIGPSLARMARRASEAAGARRRAIVVSRFGSEEQARRLRGRAWR